MWLDEIMLTSDRGFARQDVERMACVLKEQNDILIVANSIDWEVVIDVINNEDYPATKQWLIHLWNKLSAMSDDAKELLQE